MIFMLIRKWYTDKSTIGELFIDNKFLCYTLEDKVRVKKIKNITAIGSGVYNIKITYSQRFKKKLPLLLDVPEFTGIRIHSGNTDKDTSGCILVGMTKGNDIIYKSRMAFDKVYKLIEQAEENNENVKIDILDTLGPYTGGVI